MEELQEHALRVLEFEKVLERLAAHTSFSVGRQEALAIRPADDFEEAQSRQQETDEAQRLLAEAPRLALGGASDIRPLVHRASIDGVLEPSDFLGIASTLEAVHFLVATLERARGRLPFLQALARELDELRPLQEQLRRAIGPRGEVVDGASPELRAVRAELRITQERLQGKLQELVNSDLGRQVLQEPLITLRNDRFVVPVKAEFRGQVKGLIHDVSGSGATVFIEPLASVELGNAVRELQLGERREVERILRRLSRLVGEAAPALERDVALLARMDVALAKARLAQEQQATRPLLVDPESDQPGAQLLHLKGARHPLLKGRVVPIDIWVGQDFRILVITGPNTGGKTVALKTLGLLALMAQAGLFVPAAEGSQVPVFSGVYADIGDEQSIEQSLSTFSSHMGYIVAILQTAPNRSLVLLDELGAGTDPAEGSALARAVLQHLVQRGVTVVATTHHSELKAFAHETPGVQNASVEFDPETLAPTYVLTIGRPGRSNALAIAARLGLAPALIKAARSLVGAEQTRMDGLLQELERERDALAQERLRAEAAGGAAEGLRARLQVEVQDLATRKDALVAAERARLLEQAQALEEHLQSAERTLARADRQQLADLATQLKGVRQELQEAAPWQPAAPVTGGGGAGAGQRPPRLGDLVQVRGFAQAGEVVAESVSGQLEVQIGALRTKVGRDEVEAILDAPPQGEGGGDLGAERRPGAGLAPDAEVHLRGLRVDEALERLEKYLDQAFLAGQREVRIVHGKGTGTLRLAVRQVLARHPLVRSHRTAELNQGGEGVTVAELAL